MKNALILASLVVAAALVVLTLSLARQTTEPAELDAATRTATSLPPSPVVTDEGASHDGFLYGRVTTDDGTLYEGRLRFGTDEEAFWDDHFNGYKAKNPWADFVPPERLTERVPIAIFGFEFASRTRRIDLGRPFMVRFGDIARIDVDGRDLRVTLRSGTVFGLDRFNADDIADGVRIWDASRGVVDLVEWRIRSVEFLPTPGLGPLPSQLQGTVLTAQGQFSGSVQWNRESCVGSDELVGQSTDGEVRLRFDTIRSIARSSPGSSLVTLLDRREVELSGTPAVGKGHRGVTVDDRRFGRVLISWDAFERLDFNPATGSGPGYDDFPPSRPLRGTVTTRDGRRLEGRLVYDLDEGETVETLDAPSDGMNYSVPFGRIASIRLAGDDVRAELALLDGETLRLERAGDLGDDTAGMLIFGDGHPKPVYVDWNDVGRIDFDR